MRTPDDETMSKLVAEINELLGGDVTSIAVSREFTHFLSIPVAHILSKAHGEWREKELKKGRVPEKALLKLSFCDICIIIYCLYYLYCLYCLYYLYYFYYLYCLYFYIFELLSI